MTDYEQGFIDGLTEAAVTVDSMAERPYDNEPEFSAIINAEAAIVALRAKYMGTD